VVSAAGSWSFPVVGARANVVSNSNTGNAGNTSTLNTDADDPLLSDRAVPAGKSRNLHVFFTPSTSHEYPVMVNRPGAL
jgi:hypothetical protein